MYTVKKSRIRLVGLCFLTLWATVVETYTPVVFPSLDENHGLVYHERSDRILSIPGGIEQLLCVASNEDTPLSLAQGRRCTDVVVFTAEATLTLQILNLTSTGIIQPFTTIPQTNISGGRIGEVSAYGSGGTIRADSVGELSFFNPEDTDDVLAEAPDAMDVEETDIDESGEDDDSASVREIESDLPSGGGSGEIPEVVLSLNQSRNLLTADGAVRPEHAMVVEVRLEDLPDHEMVTVEVNFTGSIRRRLFIFRDARPVQTSVEFVSEREMDSTTQRTMLRYGVQFADYVLNTPNEELLRCPKVSDPLRKFSSRYLSSSRLNGGDLTAMIEAEEEFGSCNSNLDAFVATAIVHVSGVSSEVETRRRRSLNRDRLESGDRFPATVSIDFTVSLRRRTTVEISVLSSAGVGLNGLPVEAQSETYRIERLNHATLQSVNRAEELGTTSTVVVSTSVATSVGTTIGASMAASMVGSASAGGTGGVTCGGSLTSAVELVGTGQRIYLISVMAVPNMPENFKRFGNSLSWTMLDIKVPWRDDKGTTTKEVPGLDRNQDSMQFQPQFEEIETERPTSDPTIETHNASLSSVESRDVVLFTKEWPYTRIVMAFVWAALLFVGLLLLHCVLIAVFFKLRWKLPDQLRFPRMELYLCYWITPAIAGACASLFTGNSNAVYLGILLLCLFPIPFILWHLYILARHFFFKKPESLTVFFEVEKDRVKNTPLKNKYIVSESALKLANSTQPSLIERFVLTPLIGPPYVSGDWKTVDGPSNKFVGRYGPIFEDYRHIPGLRKNATLEVDPSGKQVIRGSFVPIRNESFSSVVRVSGTVLSLVRTVFTACFILGNDTPNSEAQAYILLIISISFLVIYRYYRPQTKRWKLALALANECLNIATFVVVIYLLRSERAEQQDVRRNLGALMMAFESSGFFLIFIEQLFTASQFVYVTYGAARVLFRPKPRVVKVIVDAQVTNPRYLERKYFNRWVTNTLGRGIYAGVVTRDVRAPFEEMFWADPMSAIRHYLTPKCCGFRRRHRYTRSRGEINI